MSRTLGSTLAVFLVLCGARKQHFSCVGALLGRGCEGANGHCYYVEGPMGAILLCRDCKGHYYCVWTVMGHHCVQTQRETLLKVRGTKGALLLCRTLLPSGALSAWHYFFGVTIVMRASREAAGKGWYCERCSNVGSLCRW